jgi:hypothetical protein
VRGQFRDDLLARTASGLPRDGAQGAAFDSKLRVPGNRAMSPPGTSQRCGFRKAMSGVESGAAVRMIDEQMQAHVHVTEAAASCKARAPRGQLVKTSVQRY